MKPPRYRGLRPPLPKQNLCPRIKERKDYWCEACDEAACGGYRCHNGNDVPLFWCDSCEDHFCESCYSRYEHD